MASVCSFDAFLARSFEPYGPDRLADPPVPLVWVGPDHRFQCVRLLSPGFWEAVG